MTAGAARTFPAVRDCAESSGGSVHSTVSSPSTVPWVAPRWSRWSCRASCPPPDVDPPSGDVMRVVIAEDLFLLRDGLIRLLEAYGFEIAAAVDNGPELNRALVSVKPDVAVVDV